MTQRNDGGPAYACAATLYPDGSVKDCGSEGMSLRDYFAAKAMPEVWRDIPEDANRAQALSYLGRRSYEMADALLAARERT